MTDKMDKSAKGWVREPKKAAKAPSFSEDALVDAVDVLVEEDASVVEAVPEVVVPVVEPPRDPLSETQQEAATVQRMIAEARAKVSAKKVSGGGISAEKTAILEMRKAALQSKITSLYTTSTWAGKPNYECTVCPYATLDEALIRQHVIKHI